jgi:hypothetical protein
VLAQPSVFAAVANELTATVCEPPIEAVDQEEWGEEQREHSRELVWLLDRPEQVTSRWHPQLVLCEPDIEDEDELRFVNTHGPGLFEAGCSSMTVGASGDDPMRRLGEWPGYPSS